MKFLHLFISILRANILCFILKYLTFHKLFYSPFIRICSGVTISINNKGSVILSKGVLINANTLIAATDGGKMYIGQNVGINRNSTIVCQRKITIGSNTIMGPNVLIYDHDHTFSNNGGVERNKYKSDPVKIGENCWIGAGTIILRGTTLGDNCIVGAGSIIKGTYPNGTVIIQKRNEQIKTII